MNLQGSPAAVALVSIFNLRFLGPSHFTRISGSVYARNTTSRGASNSRLMNNSCLPGSAVISVLFAILFFSFLFFLRLNFFQILVEAVEALFPELAIVANPVRRLFERGRFERARPPLRVLAAP